MVIRVTNIPLFPPVGSKTPLLVALNITCNKVISCANTDSPSRFFAGEIEKEKLQVPANYDMPGAPNQKDLIDLEVCTTQ